MGRMIGFTILYSLVSGLCVLGYQIYLWFQAGYWVGVSLSDFIMWMGWPTPYSDLEDVEAVILWCLGTPLSADIMVLPPAVLVPVLLIVARIRSSFI